ncbi:endonuclease domain-containing protein [Pseudonocardia saturnea]
MNLRRPFRGTQAVAAGLLTPKMLRGPRFRRLFRDVYVAGDVEVDLALRSCAAYLLVEDTGVLGGYSAAELLDASCGPEDAPAEVVSPTRVRSRPHLLVREGVVPDGERWRVGEVLVTSPLHTAFRLGCRLPLVEAVVVVDALTHRFALDPWEVVRFGYRYPGAAGSGQLPEVARLADPLAESPMETRIRLAIRSDGLPMPVLQHPVGAYDLDMAYPEVLLAVEYDGREHLTPERARRDLERQAHLSAAGWKVLRFRAADVLLRPWLVAAAVRRALAARGVIAAGRTAAPR